MAKDLLKLLAQHRAAHDLVTIERDDVDDANLQGYVLGLSNELVALQHVYDFHLDGLLFVRVEDITDVDSSPTDRFQRELLVREGLEQKVPFGKAFDLGGWHGLIAQVAREFGLMILEREALDEPDFAIGRVHALGEDDVQFEYFSGTASWRPDLEEIALRDITSCGVDSNYLNFYRRHFERMALS